MQYLSRSSLRNHSLRATLLEIFIKPVHNCSGSNRQGNDPHTTPVRRRNLPLSAKLVQNIYSKRSIRYANIWLVLKNFMAGLYCKLRFDGFVTQICISWSTDRWLVLSGGHRKQNRSPRTPNQPVGMRNKELNKVLLLGRSSRQRS